MVDNLFFQCIINKPTNQRDTLSGTNKDMPKKWSNLNTTSRAKGFLSAFSS